jgi:hypothetical protein
MQIRTGGDRIGFRGLTTANEKELSHRWRWRALLSLHPSYSSFYLSVHRPAVGSSDWLGFVFHGKGPFCLTPPNSGTTVLAPPLQRVGKTCTVTR